MSTEKKATRAMTVITENTPFVKDRGHPETSSRRRFIPADLPENFDANLHRKILASKSVEATPLDVLQARSDLLKKKLSSN